MNKYFSVDVYDDKLVKIHNTLEEAKNALINDTSEYIDWARENEEDGYPDLENAICGKILANYEMPMNKEDYPALAERDGWIKCSERLPKLDVRVLVFIPENQSGHKIKICARLNKHEWILNDDFRQIYDSKEIDYWQPLPNPPLNNQ
ncbi:DUF551 domain-containing protein [Pasteurellaceae bacterium USgator11]|nr:DUF551 domain-containing protein [Pasteurellaceae bacterium UScroc12]TNG94739.1 DUF551 domain-containing protein [Pasteurellaceae bacterium USgator41]TNG97710.1 DUF551 domain-containing protein [Pasteurellaceae bacterium UScroc31]TNH01671.1 DUF551 domain-containing protein [Pasteurellaceae bacterium USgator11]